MGVKAVNSRINMRESRYAKGNPFRSIYIPKDPKEILDTAFKKALRISPPGGIRLNIIKRKKSVTITRIKTLSNELYKRLLKIVKSLPSVDNIHPFYASVMEIWLSKDDYKRYIAKIHGAAKLVQRIAEDYILRIRSTKKTEEIPVKEVLDTIDKLRIEAYGRISSVIESLSTELARLADLIRKMKKLPDYDPSLPAIVVSGPPNAGKSSFVKAVSNARVEIASYPFTTKNITFGHINFIENGIIIGKAQIADTPGLFDRPINERKEPELLALNAIKYLADIIVFLFDGSYERVMDYDEQIRVYKTVREFLGRDKPAIIAINKVDIRDDDLITKLREYITKKENKEYIEISAKNGYNLNILTERIRRALEIS